MNSEIIQRQKPQRSRLCRLKTRALACEVLAAATLCLAGAIARAADPNSQPAVNVIHVDVSGLHNGTGQVVCALFASPNGFPHDFDKALMHTTVGISNQHASCEFHDVKPATYAITVVHDELQRPARSQRYRNPEGGRRYIREPEAALRNTQVRKGGALLPRRPPRTADQDRLPVIPRKRNDAVSNH